MIMTNKIVAVALITALIGASLGAAVMHSRDSSNVAETKTTVPASAIGWDSSKDARYTEVAEQPVPAEFNTTAEQTAYKVGFADGFQACGVNGSVRTSRAGANTRVYRSNASNSRRAYYDYKPQGRSFWSKHRDKLTVGMGAGGGALIGALIGGKKGAAIGSLAGAGGSALYTYKLRKRNRSR